MKRQISLTLIITMIFLAILPLLNINAQVIEKDKHWSREEVRENEIISIEFPYEIEIENIEVPEGMEYMGYEDGQHIFKALEDLEKVEGYLYYKKEIKQDINEKESGEASINGTPSKGEGTQIDWGQFSLGKNAWDLDDNKVNFAIRINLEDYYDNDYIIIEDIPSDNLILDGEVTVNRLNQEDNKVVNDGTVNYEVLSNDKNGFTIKVPVDKSTLVYDVVYFMKNTGGAYSNEYKVYTVDQWEDITSNANINGSIKNRQSIHLKNIWKNALGVEIDPSEVYVQISGGSQGDITVLLNELNNWEKTITDLETDVEYNVLEPGFDPEDFNVEVNLVSEENNQKNYEVIITLLKEDDSDNNQLDCDQNSSHNQDNNQEGNENILDKEDKDDKDDDIKDSENTTVEDNNNIDNENKDNNNKEDNKDIDNKEDNKDSNIKDNENNSNTDKNTKEKSENLENIVNDKNSNSDLKEDLDREKIDTNEDGITTKEVEEEIYGRTESRVIEKNKDKKERDFNKREEYNKANEDKNEDNNKIKDNTDNEDKKDTKGSNLINNKQEGANLVNKNKKGNKAPQTGDNFNLIRNIFIVGISILILFVINKDEKIKK